MPAAAGETGPRPARRAPPFHADGRRRVPEAGSPYWHMRSATAAPPQPSAPARGSQIDLAIAKVRRPGCIHVPVANRAIVIGFEFLFHGPAETAQPFPLGPDRWTRPVSAEPPISASNARWRHSLDFQRSAAPENVLRIRGFKTNEAGGATPTGNRCRLVVGDDLPADDRAVRVEPAFPIGPAHNCHAGG